MPAKQLLYSHSRIPSKINSGQCLLSAFRVENGLLSIILQTWHDLDLSQLWKQGRHKSKYLTHRTQSQKIQNICDEKLIEIFQYFPYLLSTILSSLVTTNMVCKYNLKKFPFQCFQSPRNAQLTNSLVSMFSHFPGNGQFLNHKRTPPPRWVHSSLDWDLLVAFQFLSRAKDKLSLVTET